MCKERVKEKMDGLDGEPSSVVRPGIDQAEIQHLNTFIEKGVIEITDSHFVWGIRSFKTKTGNLEVSHRQGRFFGGGISENFYTFIKNGEKQFETESFPEVQKAFYDEFIKHNPVNEKLWENRGTAKKIKQPATDLDYKKLKKYGVYKITTKKGAGYAVKETKKGAGGSSIYATKSEAEAESNRLEQVDTLNEKYHKEIAAKEAIKKGKEVKRQEELTKKRENSNIQIDQNILASSPKLIAGRIKKYLSSKVNFKGIGVATWQEIIESGNYISKALETVPAITFNRRKYNRMEDPEEQRAYEKRTKELKTEYHLHTQDDRFLKIPKMIFDVIFVKETTVLKKPKTIKEKGDQSE